jgi:hypothetical protein
MKRFHNAKASLAGLFTALLLTTPLQAAELKSLRTCAFLMMGEGGPEHQMLLDYQAAALDWGVKLETTTYMNENIVTQEFQAGACDLANMTGMQARRFNKFTGTLDSPGGIPTYEHLKMVVNLLAKPSAAKYMKEGSYEVVGIQPGGAVYLYTHDRRIGSMSDLAGRKMGILEGMPEIRRIVTQIGMTPVSSTLSNLYQKFNNGVVDVTPGPAILYGMMELDKGMQPDGGILRAPIMQGNLQFVARADKLPPGFGQRSREYFAANFDATLRIIQQAENEIPEHWWIPIPKGKEEEFRSQTRRIRIAFRDSGVYDPRMLTLLRKVRCRKDPTLSECTSRDAE